MALDMSKLTRLAGGSGVNLWYYTSNDALSARVAQQEAISLQLKETKEQYTKSRYKKN